MRACLQSCGEVGIVIRVTGQGWLQYAGTYLSDGTPGSFPWRMEKVYEDLRSSEGKRPDKETKENQGTQWHW